MKKKKRVGKVKEGWNKENLRAELSDPAAFQKHFMRLESLLETDDHLRTIRFPGEKLLGILNETIELYQEELDEISDPEKQRSFILTHVLPEFLSGRFMKKMERDLTDYLKKNIGDRSNLAAISAALFFLEYHRRHPDACASNPLWELIFSLSYEEALPSGVRGTEDAPEAIEVPVLKDMLSIDISNESFEKVRLAIEYLESGVVDLGFSFETILQGLRIYKKKLHKAGPEKIIAALRDCYFKEIGWRERDDLIWGLEYAVDQYEGEQKKAYEVMLDACSLIPVGENPVIFATYYKCIVAFYRYLKPEELEYAKEILDFPDEVLRVLRYAWFLFNQEAPKRSLKAFEAACALDPENPLGYLGVGIALWEIEAFREAQLSFARALKFSGEFPQLMAICENLSHLDTGMDLPNEIYRFLSEKLPPLK